MSWASRRKTTRIEDEAYCLIGIFDVHMPLLYGEGANAFIRLQREIIAQCTDQSIFAWTTQMPGTILGRTLPDLPSSSPHYLAPSPRCFAFSGSFEPIQHEFKKKSHYLSRRGLKLTAGIVFVGTELFYMKLSVYAVLDCFDTERCNRRLACRLHPANDIDAKSATEFHVLSWLVVDASLATKLERVRPVTIRDDLYENHAASMDLRIRCFFEKEWNAPVSTAGHTKASDELPVGIIKWHPEDSWDPQRSILTFHKSDQQLSGSTELEKPVCQFMAMLRYTPHSRTALGKTEAETTAIVYVYYRESNTLKGIEPKFRLETDPKSIESAWNDPCEHAYFRPKFHTNTTSLHHEKSGVWDIHLLHINPPENDPYGSLSFAVRQSSSVSHLITNTLSTGSFAKKLGRVELQMHHWERKLEQAFEESAEYLDNEYSKKNHTEDPPRLTLKELYGSRKLWRQANTVNAIAPR